ncbi:MAG: hypothetical protein JSR83_18710 [Proteobacteria bacterium]|nr:hypothetical protein [Pseudomonadota bacterium]
MDQRAFRPLHLPFSPMNTPTDVLHAYVSAILDKPSPLVISGTTVERSSWLDQGFEVTKEVTDYAFNNGAVIRRTVEQDNFPCESACAEVWITYEVISSGDVALGISPQCKTFENACRESFWLAYHSA